MKEKENHPLILGSSIAVFLLFLFLNFLGGCLLTKSVACSVDVS